MQYICCWQVQCQHQGSMVSTDCSWKMNAMYGTLYKHLIERGLNATASRETKFLLLIRNLKPRPSISSHRDFLPKFISLHYHTTLEDVLGVQRSRQSCLFGQLFFRQNGMTFKKPTKIIKIQWKATVFWDIFRVGSILAGKQRPKPIRWTKVDQTASFDTQVIPRGGIIVEISWFLHFFLRFLTCGAT